MTNIAAFVGHSFQEKDAEVVRKFVDFFDHIVELDIGFTWDHAEDAEPKILSEKVKEKMRDKNLFIGICTLAERVISSEKLARFFIGRGYLLAKEAEYQWKTSDWILQEIGCAFGKDMRMILLVEKNLRRPGGIQGDLEYIPFDRNQPEESFTKILEMIKALLPTKPAEYPMVRTQTLAPSAEVISPVETSTAAQSLDFEKWTRDEYDKAILMAIASENEAREREVMDAFAASQHAADENERVSWQATRLFYYHLLKKKQSLDEFLHLVKHNPTHSGAHYLLARVFESYEEFVRAAQSFEQAAEHASTIQEKLRNLCYAAVAHVKSSNIARAHTLLNDAQRKLTEVDDGDLIYFDAVGAIAEYQHDDLRFLAFSEAFLERRPDDHDRRFALAYKYGEIDEDDLATKHYQIIARRRPTEAVLNNLGVAQMALGLNSRAVQSYKESEAIGGTLAISNLAHKLIASGFLEEAKVICERAINIDNYDPQVGSAISRIKELATEEEKKERESIQAAEPRRLAYVAFARACVEAATPEIQAIFQGPEYQLKLSIQNGILEARGTFEKVQQPYPWLLSYPTIQQKPTTKLLQVLFRGEVNGLGAKYKQWIYEGPDVPSEASEPTAQGLMTISKNLTKISVYQRRAKTEEKYFDLHSVAQ